MDPLDEPAPSTVLCELFGRPVMLRCHRCGRVRAVGQGESEEWEERAMLITMRGLAASDVWLWDMTCGRCPAVPSSPNREALL